MPTSPPALDLEHFLPYRLSVLANTMSAAIARTYSDRFGLSIPEWRVLAVLARSPGLAAADCAERTAMDKVAVSRAVASLVRAGRIVRTRELHDRRRSALSLTPRGQRVYRQVVPWALAYEAAILRGLPGRTRVEIAAVLGVLQARARALSAARVPTPPRRTRRCER
jgi:DNA-binding MarR family transcriptional regulator